MKRIVVTTDLSNDSKAAFATARTIAQGFGATVILLALIEDPAQAALLYALDFPVFPEPEVHEQMIAKVLADLKNLAALHFNEIHCEVAVRDAAGSVPSEIVKFAKEQHADLLVLSSHGRGGLSRLIIGSITEQVARESSCPVLIVPPQSTSTETAT